MAGEVEALSRADVVAGLRAWARGIYATEAAAELLIRFNAGAGSPLLSGPWVRRDAEAGWVWFDVELVDDGGYLSSGERRVLSIAASLAEPAGALVALGDAISGLDRAALDLVLATVAHAGGSHEHSHLAPDPHGRWADGEGRRLSSRRLGTLHAWPGDESGRE